MKILSVAQTREADQYTIENEPVSSIDLMERAAMSCSVWLLKRYGRTVAFRIFCGNGNNGGDGLAIARQLSEQGCDVKVFILRLSDNDSKDFTENLSRLKKSGKCEISVLTNENIALIHVSEGRVIVDALIGSGMKGEATGNFAKVIDAVNGFGNEIVSIDIPSGLNGDDNSTNSHAHVIRAKHTLTFQYPKLSFLFAENNDFVGEFHVLNIGIHADYLKSAKTNYHYTVHEEVKALLSVRGKFSHKGTYGHALIVAGSKGKMGAAVLSVRACLRAGAGLVSAAIPKCGTLIMQTAVPEAMVNESEGEENISGRIEIGPDKMAQYHAVGIGPGIGKEKETANAMKLLLNQFSGPMVIDADALNILAENKTWIAFLPKNTILTPHPGEFDRLTQKHNSGFARMKTQRELAFKHGIYIVLKGAYTSIACPDGSVHFNSSGNPGMAAGGSGDVLTGIITGLLAQGYVAFDSCLIGVYLHGLAGDIAASVNTENGVVAGDITEQLGGAWRMMVG